ncbi:hypothetical protein BH10BAC3_BH10BAC3_31510 [soil metagenome]
MIKRIVIVFVLLLIYIVQLTAQLQANFTIDKPGGCSPLEVGFTNTTSGAPAGITYNWDFGNGNSSTLVNPGATYSVEKSYTVTLTATSGGIKSAISKTITVYRKPTVDFSATPSKGCAPLQVNFSSTVSPGDGTIAKYLWDFGDGITVQGNNLGQTAHLYTVPQQPPLSLTVTNSYGCYTAVDKKKLVEVYGLINASFTASATFTCSPQTINFTNTSGGSGKLAYEWDFGDGTTGSVMSPSHKYTSAGIFIVRLTVKNDAGCADKANNVTVKVGGYKADFTVPPTICEGQSAIFSNRSTRPYDSLKWTVDNIRKPASPSSGNMSNKFTAAGNYTVKLIAWFSGCTDTAVKTVSVGAVPPLNGFLIQTDNSCGLPVTFTFTDTGKTAVKWLWKYGNFSTVFDSAKTGAHTFASAFTDRIGVTITNAGGCSNSASKNINYYPTDVAVIIKKSASPATSLNRGCPGLSVTFSANPLNEITSFAWNLGDGTTSAKPEPSHTYNIAGSYRVSLDYVTKTGCTGTAIFDSIYINGVQPSDFTVSPSTQICGNSEVTFTPSVALPNRDYIWLIDGKVVTSLLTPDAFVHRFQKEGVYTIGLVVRAGNCTDTVTKVDYITVVPPFPKIKAAINTCAGTRGMVEFIDTSRLTNNWVWNFGDGSSPLVYNSFRPKINHEYVQTGMYKVTLTGTNGNCTITDSLDVQVLLQQKPLLSVSAGVVCTSDSPVISLSNYELHPSADSSQPYTILKLQFGDLTSSTATIDPGSWATGFSAAVYGLETGKQDIRIITTSQYFNCEDTSNFAKLKINGPVAGFSFSALSCFKQPVVLKDSSHALPGSPIVKWEWLFGDSTITTAANGNSVSHAYGLPGTYQLGLRVTDAGGCVQQTPADSAHLVTLTGPAANFIVSDTNVIVNDTVFFYNRSAQTDNSDFTWRFSDGSVTTDKDTYFVYDKEGDFTVKLTAVNRGGGCSDTAVKQIHARRVQSVFDYEVTFSSISNCPPVIVTLHSHSLNADSVRWVFGDGGESGNEPEVTHVFNNVGLYKIVLYSYDGAGHSDSAFSFVDVKGPSAVLKSDTYIGCNSTQVRLSADTSNAVSFKWDFGDGTIIAGKDTFATHIYTTPGVYIPALILSDSNGCTATSQLVQNIIIDSLSIGFAASPDIIICDSALVIFTPAVYSLSKERFDSAVQFKWTSAMHPNNSLQTETASWNFNKPGLHNVKLEVSSAFGCKATVTKQVDIKQGVYAAINTAALACRGSDVTFFGQAIPSTPGLTWNWQLGDNMVSNKQNPDPVVYATAGQRQVSLTVNNGFCSDTAFYTANIFANPALQLTASKPYLCLGDTALLGASGGISCKWTPAASFLSNGGFNAVVKPGTSTFYKATVTDSAGCATTDSVEMKVVQPFKLQVQTPLFTCVGGLIQMSAVGAVSYQWTGEDFNSTAPRPMVMPLASTSYKVLGYDGFNCFSDSVQVFVQVGKLPLVNAGPDQKILAGQEITLAGTYSADVVKWNWSPSDFLSCNNCPAPVSKPVESINYVLTVTNNIGCSATDTLRVEMICGSNFIYIPTGFTPNGDNLNDRFSVHGSGVRSNRLAVFERWGKVVFERKEVNPYDINSSWDGTYNGHLLDSGSYVYLLEAACDKGEPFTFKGTVTLIR